MSMSHAIPQGWRLSHSVRSWRIELRLQIGSKLGRPVLPALAQIVRDEKHTPIGVKSIPDKRSLEQVDSTLLAIHVCSTRSVLHSRPAEARPPSASK